MLRYVFLGFVLTAAIVGFRIATHDTADSSQTESPPISQNSPAIQAENPVEIIPAAPRESGELTEWAITPTQGNTEFDIQNSALDETRNFTTPTAWAEPEISPDLPQKYQRIGVSARALKIDHEKISALRSGDKIELPIPQLGQTFQMQVENVTRHGNGDRSLKGHIDDDETPYSVIMTEGKTITFATINTPGGSFTLEAEGDQGWIMSAADLDYLIDPSLDDFKIPAFSE